MKEFSLLAEDVMALSHVAPDDAEFCRCLTVRLSISSEDQARLVQAAAAAGERLRGLARDLYSEDQPELAQQAGLRAGMLSTLAHYIKDHEGNEL